jgi:hypothetical protein
MPDGASQPPAYGAPGYPPQYPQGYPPAGYGQPGYPSQAGYPQQAYGQYGMPQPGQAYAPAEPTPKVKNSVARAALLYGGISLGVNIVGLFFFHFYLTGILAVYAIYLGIRALILAVRVPGNPGIGAAIGGLVMAVLSLGITVLGFVVR